ncbi:succinate dehydrogenase, cytochrome b556 subunit [Meiothermus granaticius]|uniref:Succinate dehydrogenase 2 membrane subunit SdhC n=1 Tax=Meiothermus granaticius NBRC 107808 TaxID=1227551 RepID=A0A399F819_9DEIN|nr:succinate dehydrogenase, cytochrome b556 subunit [Meiothermus granaticius]MCL6526936.1 succinate dehydrogenase, cytochrome b556 subunit [Thermaceae bacterium]RIH92260.1 Succinate dehydrogenase 2 membrane subunit SdhC [Meiothermus granaticius NBRC 107808]GEM86470.1 succinate dehydrogenase, cytochrome b556 subunit [Meiothermus granaticius NBRC 107808]
MYRGREGQWAFFLHRISGLALLLWLFIHTLNIASAMWGPAVSNRLMAFFHVPIFQIGLLLVTAAAMYHSFNGLRIILMDFTGWGVRYQRQLWYGVLGLCVLLAIPGLILTVPRILHAASHGGGQ